MNIQIIVLATIIFGYFITIAAPELQMQPAGSTTYISYVDDVLGFYKVRNLDIPPRKFEYNNHILNIKQGDTIIWQNDAERTTFTILNDQNLWDNSVGYLRVGSKVNYRFDNPGKYTFYMKEHTSIRQTVIVDPLYTVTKKDVPVMTPVITPTIATPISTIISPKETVSTNITPFRSSDIYKVTSVHDMSKIPDTKIFDIKIPIKISPTTIAGIIVVILSIFITYKAGKNKGRNKRRNKR